MEIYPAAQLQMLAAAFLGGVLFGVIFELLGVLRTLLFLHTPPPFIQPWYLAPLPLLHCPLGLPRARGKKALRGFVICVQDLLFCCAFSTFVIVVLYAYNDGVIRLSVPALALLGLLSFRVLLSPFFGRANAYLAFVLALLLRYIARTVMLPFCLLWRLARRVLWRGVRSLYLTMRKRRLYRISCALCHAQCANAETGFLKIKKEAK